MELVLVIVFGLPLGRLVPDRKVAWAVLGALFLIILPFQTAVVRDTGDLDAIYWPIQVLIAGLGFALVALGARWRTRRGLGLEGERRPNRPSQ